MPFPEKKNHQQTKQRQNPQKTQKESFITSGVALPMISYMLSLHIKHIPPLTF